MLDRSGVALRICRVTCRGIHGIEQAVEVNAVSLYKAVAHRPSRSFRGGHNQSKKTKAIDLVS